MANVSVVIPAYNEAKSVRETLERVKAAFDRSSHTCEILVVDDGSVDSTSEEARHQGALVFRHPINIGYGNALLTGIRQARYPILCITDADGTYPLEELPDMVSELLEKKLDMLVGARTGNHYRGSFFKRIGRKGLQLLAEFVCGRHIPDVNSGLRVMRRDMVLKLSKTLCGGFSFTTTLTITAFLTYHFVAYRNISYAKRVGKSHVRYFRDVLRSLNLLAIVIVSFNPIKLFLLFSGCISILGSLLLAVCWLKPEFTALALLGSQIVLTVSMLMACGFFAARQPISFSTTAQSHGLDLSDQSEDHALPSSRVISLSNA